MQSKRLLLLLLGVVISALSSPLAASAEVPLTTRFAENTRGDLAVAANTLMSCPDGGGAEIKCVESRQGIGGLAALNNNGYAMTPVDVDSDAGTFDSSRATLSLPTGAQVDFAGLYYGGRLTKGTGGAAAPDPAAAGTVLFQSPGAASYSTLAASVLQSTGIAGAYVGFVDVTAAVAAAGSGEYGVADVQSGTGEDRYAGWSLVVAYSDPAAEPRSIRVFDGLVSIEQGDPAVTIPVAGLETPTAGAVSTDLALVSYEGDRGSSGDRLSLDGQGLSDAANPINNVFNSSISAAGADVGGRTPGYVNQLGFDADRLNADGILGNVETEAQLAESTTLDQYLTQVVATSIELDPVALEPPPPPPEPTPPAPVPAAPQPAPETKPEKPKKKEGGGGGNEKPDEAQLSVDVQVPDSARPEAIVGIEVEVSAEAAAAHDVQVCTAVPKGLEVRRADGAKVHGGRACWHVAKLPKGGHRTFRMTAEVSTDSSATLKLKTVVSSTNSSTRRSTAVLRVKPLPNTPCVLGRASRGSIAEASC